MENIIVLVAAAAFVAFTLWWFFGKHEKTSAEARLSDGSQSVEVTVDGGYTPNSVVLRQGAPAIIIFNRKDSSSCFSHVVFPDFGINEELPVNKKHQVQIDTSKEGEFNYSCGMNMFHGRVIIKK